MRFGLFWVPFPYGKQQKLRKVAGFKTAALGGLKRLDAVFFNSVTGAGKSYQGQGGFRKRHQVIFRTKLRNFRTNVLFGPWLAVVTSPRYTKT